MFRPEKDDVSGKLKMLYNEKTYIIYACRLLLLGRWNYASLLICIGYCRQGMNSGGKTCWKAVILRTEKEGTVVNILN